MISVSEVVKGGTGEVFLKLTALVDRPTRDLPISVRCVFHVPGDLGVPDFTGVRVFRYYKRYGYLLVEIEVPTEFVSGENAYNRDEGFLLYAKRFIIESIREAIRLAGEYFARKKMPFDAMQANEWVERMDSEMTVDAMKEAVAYPKHKPPSAALLDRVRKAKVRTVPRK